MSPKFILILSGKGGVGKTTVSANLSRCLSSLNVHVGILDLDLTGPSIPTIFGAQEAKIQNRNGRMIPYKIPNYNIEIVSLGLMLNNQNDAIIWRGPKKNRMIQSFFNLIQWESDYVIIDMPPGTSDEHLSTMEILKSSGIDFQTLIITTPNILSIADVRKEISLCWKIGIDVNGIVENFSGIVCPCCSELTQFNQNEDLVEKLSKETNIPVLSKIPFLPQASLPVSIENESQVILPYFKPIAEMILN